MKQQQEPQKAQPVLQPLYRKINVEDIKYNYNRIVDDINEIKVKNNIDYHVEFMAVTKTVAPEYVNVAIECGIKTLGENRVQEYLSKKDKYIDSADVQIIGSLQTNKVKYIINDVSMIQSVNSVSLAEKINSLAEKNNKIMNVLVEINIGDEESKSGIDERNLNGFLEQLSVFKNIKVNGLMAIPPRNAPEDIYYRMNKLFIDTKDKNMDNINMNILSIGMSGDYKMAIKHGSTMIRIGTGLFGSRN